eukprot:GSA25T00009708001.1
MRLLLHFLVLVLVSSSSTPRRGQVPTLPAGSSGSSAISSLRSTPLSLTPVGNGTSLRNTTPLDIRMQQLVRLQGGLQAPHGGNPVQACGPIPVFPPAAENTFKNVTVAKEEPVQACGPIPMVFFLNKLDAGSEATGEAASTGRGASSSSCSGAAPQLQPRGGAVTSSTEEQEQQQQRDMLVEREPAREALDVGSGGMLVYEEGDIMNAMNTTSAGQVAFPGPRQSSSDIEKEERKFGTMTSRGEGGLRKSGGAGGSAHVAQQFLHQTKRTATAGTAQAGTRLTTTTGSANLSGLGAGFKGGKHSHSGTRSATGTPRGVTAAGQLGRSQQTRAPSQQQGKQQPSGLAKGGPPRGNKGFASHVAEGGTIVAGNYPLQSEGPLLQGTQSLGPRGTTRQDGSTAGCGEMNKAKQIGQVLERRHLDEHVDEDGQSQSEQGSPKKKAMQSHALGLVRRTRAKPEAASAGKKKKTQTQGGPRGGPLAGVVLGASLSSRRSCSTTVPDYIVSSTTGTACSAADCQHLQIIDKGGHQIVEEALEPPLSP